ncbi:DEP domain-containing protein 1A [Trichinella pseudospiralis]|uniref:DEP domain-containing protein 1A n=1 Tax=Trichinella pseudospiralis TaxID=6337 RepID=A0A0V1JC66_TRIPS|nr:DEP domain-containing protein 1A [Trichinella pseudospiralis]KRZ40780.1 DEP domain-containing protein 1A [Trichinella pseudospiralis]
MASQINERYAATQMWNDALRAFRSTMPLREHKRKLKSYPNTFTGCEAVNWLHGYLCARSNLQRPVTRDQAFSLLQKFAGCNVFVDAKTEKQIFEEELKDDETLYSFTDIPISSLTQTPLALKNMPKSCPTTNISDLLKRYELAVPMTTDSYRPLTYNEASTQHMSSMSSKNAVGEIWKTTCLESLMKLLKVDSLNMLDVSSISAQNIAFNVSHINDYGMTTVQHRSDDLPKWILQAMKCLAHWPWQNDLLDTSCYVGFERDVLRTIVDFFNSPQCGCLIPQNFESLLLDILERAETIEKDNRQKEHQNIELACSRTTLDIFNTCMTTGSIPDAIQVDPTLSMLSMGEFQPSCLSPATINKEGSSYKWIQASSKLNPMVAGSRASISCAMPRADYFEFIEPTISWRPRMRSSIAEYPSGRLGQAGLSSRNLRDLCMLVTFKTTEARNFAVEAVQIVLLLLQPRQRRWLQILLRFMARVSVNHCLHLDKLKSVSNRVLIVDALANCFSSKESRTEGKNVHRLLDFLLNFQFDIFKVPKRLEEDVKAKICLERECSALYNENNPPPYCDRISVEQFNRQSFDSSKDALMQLLDTIINDPSSTDREKNKNLKRFQKTYPILFQERFPDQVDILSIKREGWLNKLKEKLKIK